MDMLPPQTTPLPHIIPCMISETPLNLPANYASSTLNLTSDGILVIQEVSTEITERKSEESCTLNYSWCLLSDGTNGDGHGKDWLLRQRVHVVWNFEIPAPAGPADEASEVFYSGTVMLPGMDAASPPSTEINQISPIEGHWFRIRWPPCRQRVIDLEPSKERDALEDFIADAGMSAACFKIVISRVKEHLGGDIPVAVQGVCSYTVYAGPKSDFVAQFRLKFLQLTNEEDFFEGKLLRRKSSQADSSCEDLAHYLGDT
ncbi:hypothetical protein RJ035_004316 [Blastomyces gilchristii]